MKLTPANTAMASTVLKSNESTIQAKMIQTIPRMSTSHHLSA